MPLSFFMSLPTRDSGLPAFLDFQDSNPHLDSWSVIQLAAALHQGLLSPFLDACPPGTYCHLTVLVGCILTSPSLSALPGTWKHQRIFA